VVGEEGGCERHIFVVVVFYTSITIITITIITSTTIIILFDQFVDIVLDCLVN